MLPNPRVGKAFKAMTELGFDAGVVKLVMRRLGKLYSKSFSLIEEDNYRALVDAILDDMDAKARAQEKEKIVDKRDLDEEPQPLLKRPLRQHVRDQEGLAVSPEDPTVSTGSQPRSAWRDSANLPVPNGTLPSEQCLQQEDVLVTKGKDPMPSHVSPRSRKRPLARRRQLALRIIDQPAKGTAADYYSLIVPKDEPLDELPLAVISPDCSNENPSDVRDIATQDQPGQEEGNCLVNSRELPRVKQPGVGSNTNGSSSELEIASSSSGEVKLSLSFQPLLGRPSFQMPALDEVLRSVKERCSQHGLLGENFSVLPILKEMCQCFLESATDPDNEPSRSIRETDATRG